MMIKTGQGWTGLDRVWTGLWTELNYMNILSMYILDRV